MAHHHLVCVRLFLSLFFFPTNSGPGSLTDSSAAAADGKSRLKLIATAAAADSARVHPGFDCRAILPTHAFSLVSLIHLVDAVYILSCFLLLCRNQKTLGCFHHRRRFSVQPATKTKQNDQFRSGGREREREKKKEKKSLACRQAHDSKMRGSPAHTQLGQYMCCICTEIGSEPRPLASDLFIFFPPYCCFFQNIHFWRRCLLTAVTGSSFDFLSRLKALPDLLLFNHLTCQAKPRKKKEEEQGKGGKKITTPNRRGEERRGSRVFEACIDSDDDKAIRLHSLPPHSPLDRCLRRGGGEDRVRGGAGSGVQGRLPFAAHSFGNDHIISYQLDEHCCD